MPHAPFVLVIRDGWGMNPFPEHDGFNAVKIASQRGLTPVADALMRDYPWTLVKTSGEDVGLPDGTMGNSEVGHQNIGAGRIVDQESVAITKACRAGLEHNTVIAAAINKAKSSGGAVHLMGINSDAGVHGLLDHLYACVRACKVLGQREVYLHLFTDGRDTGPFTGLEFAQRVEKELTSIGLGTIVSIMGRYYAMDRDYRWERVSRAYGVLTGNVTLAGDAKTFGDVSSAIQNYYDAPDAKNLGGDEFITPRYIGKDAASVAASRISNGDSVIFFNYRGDRPREISAAFVFDDSAWAKVKPSPDSGKNGFDRGTKLDLHYVTMTAYWEELAPYVHVAYPKPPKMVNIAGEFLAKSGLTQFRCAETEKYPHVTFFFNDYRDEPFPGERRENPQSPRVATYDLMPQMSAHGVRDAVLSRLAAADCEDVLIVNFANGDMVGHTGVLEAAITACATVDACVGEIIRATLAKGGNLIITADHGNAEQMFDPATGSPHTAHTTYDVPMIVVGEKFKNVTLRGDRNPAGWSDVTLRQSRGRLADIMPTAIHMMGLKKPVEMSGESLIQ
jgi:2,3-bisphosphoglycerate-independent phosphoglycerate mutase